MFNNKKTIDPKIDPSIDNTSVSINFDNLNIFSIERILVDNKSVTTIGYYDKQNNINEWTLNISPIQHINLCKYYKIYLDKIGNNGITCLD